MFLSIPSIFNFSFFFLDILFAGGGKSSVGKVIGKGDSGKESSPAKGSEAGLGFLDLFLLREIFTMIEAGRFDLVLLEILSLASSLHLVMADGRKTQERFCF